MKTLFLCLKNVPNKNFRVSEHHMLSFVFWDHKKINNLQVLVTTIDYQILVLRALNVFCLHMFMLIKYIITSELLIIRVF